MIFQILAIHSSHQQKGLEVTLDDDSEMNYEDYSIDSIEMPAKFNTKRETVNNNAPKNVYDLVMKILDTMQHGAKNNMRRAMERQLQRKTSFILE